MEQDNEEAPNHHNAEGDCEEAHCGTGVMIVLYVSFSIIPFQVIHCLTTMKKRVAIMKRNVMTKRRVNTTAIMHKVLVYA
jgi:hypothetical protein